MLVKTRKRKITGSDQVANVFRSILSAEHECDRDKEHFWVMGLNTQNQIQYLELVSLGLLDRAIVHAREVFRYAVMQAVSCIILCHNHPGGSTEPSQQDRDVTQKLVKAGETLGIKVIDHVIVAQDGYYSFAEHGEV